MLTNKDSGQSFTVPVGWTIRVDLHPTSDSKQGAPFANDNDILERLSAAAYDNGDSTATFRAVRNGKTSIWAHNDPCSSLSSTSTAPPGPCGAGTAAITFTANITVTS